MHRGRRVALAGSQPADQFVDLRPRPWKERRVIGSVPDRALRQVDPARGGAVDHEVALPAPCTSPVVKFAAIAGADHFDVLAPATEAIARAIAADTGPQVSITLDTAAIARGVETSR